MVHALSVGQKRRGHDVGVIALLEAGADEPSLLSELREAGLPVISIANPRRSYLAQRRSLLDCCRDLAPTILHSHGYHPDVLAASMGKKVQTTRVTTLHGFTGGGWRNGLYEWMQRRSLPRFDAVIAVSRRLADELSTRLPHTAFHAVPNAWTPVETPMPRDVARKAIGVATSVFSIGWIGRISAEKGADVLVDALPALADLPLQVTFIGEGPERRRLEDRANRLGLGGRVEWRGGYPRASRVMPGFDLLVISSRTEGTPITLFEAVHAGVPVVATRVGGIPDVISSSEATLIDPENPSALAAAIRDVHDRRGAAVSRAERAHIRLVKEFEATPWIASYDGIYEAAVARRASK